MDEAGLKVKSLSEWLTYLDLLHPETIEMGLGRVEKVWFQLDLKINFPVIIVGGTNGKGSVCTMLEAILSCDGYHTGCYTSPHLIRYNERVRIQQQEISDDFLCQAFEIVDQARINCGVLLTIFESVTLAAMVSFIQARVDVAILEVGLGGRLDAVNIFAADCAIITSLGLDHTDYLGNTIEAIGREKAGIFRQGRPAICAQYDPPVSIYKYAKELVATYLQIGQQFGYSKKVDHWDFWGPHGRCYALPYPVLRGDKQLQNASACLTALAMLDSTIPTSMGAKRQGLLTANLPGRFQVIPGEPVVVLDVAHNPDAAHVLAENLSTMKVSGRTFAIFSMLKDKEVYGVIDAIKNQIDIWLVSATYGPRGIDADGLIAELHNAGIDQKNAIIHSFTDTVAAYVFACKQANKNDRICVLGSFHTVGAVLQYQNIVQSE